MTAMFVKRVLTYQFAQQLLPIRFEQRAADSWFARPPSLQGNLSNLGLTAIAADQAFKTRRELAGDRRVAAWKIGAQWSDELDQN